MGDDSAAQDSDVVGGCTDYMTGKYTGDCSGEDFWQDRYYLTAI